MDLDDFQIKKVDEDKSEMPKFNIQLNHVQRNSENQNQQEEINPFQVNLKDREIYNLVWKRVRFSLKSDSCRLILYNGIHEVGKDSWNKREVRKF